MNFICARTVVTSREFQTARNLTEKGRFYMSSHAPKSSALGEFKPFVNITDLKDTAP